MIKCFNIIWNWFIFVIVMIVNIILRINWNIGRYGIYYFVVIIGFDYVICGINIIVFIKFRN